MTQVAPQRPAVLRSLAFAGTLLIAAAAFAATPIKIMPLGDSITQGGRIESRLDPDEGTVGYRYSLYFLLKNAGYDVDFVGTRNTIFSPTDNPPIPPTIPNPADYPLYNTTFDRDNEGHWGTTANSVNSTSNITAWMNSLNAAGNAPDIVLLHLGTNDLRTAAPGSGVTTVVNNVGGIIDKIRAVKPNVKVFVATLDNNISDENDVRAEYNTKLGTMVAGKTTAGSPVYLVDMIDVTAPIDPNKFNADTGTYDGTHMNKHGEDITAQLWYNALVSTGAIPEPTALAMLAGGATLLTLRRRRA